MRNLIKKNPKYSKRINYDALKDLFVDGSEIRAPGPPIDFDDKDDADLYTMDDKSDGEGMGMVVIEEPGNVSVAPTPPVAGARKEPLFVPHEGDDDDVDGDGDADDAGGWEDGYEQEV